MSYSGTVYCRYCGGKGHNKRTCPDYTETLRKRALAEIESDGRYDGYWGRLYNKRVRKTGLYADGTPMPAEVKAANKVRRRCKYCNAEGHNRRTCPVLKSDTAAWIEREIEFRQQIQAAAESHGVGVGALLKTERWGDTHAWMVVGIAFDQIQSRTIENAGVVVAQRLGTTGHREQQALVMPVMGEINANAWSKSQVIGPVPSVHFPADFATAEALSELAKEHFKDARSECWYDNAGY